MFRNEGTLPTLKSMVLGHPVVAELLLERIPLEDIPEDAEKATNWLHETYFHKVSNTTWCTSVQINKRVIKIC